MSVAMARVERVPVIPEPPHDPSSMLIDDRAGWQLAGVNGLTDVHVSPCDGALELALRPDVAPTFTHPSGNFGGLVLPANVAVASDGSVFLLSPGTGTLKRFDPCCCRFVDVPCLGGRGGGARQVRRARSIAICCDVLYVVDRGVDGVLGEGTNAARAALRARLRRENHRVSVFVLPGFELRGHLRPPCDLFERWRPVAVACGSDGSIWVLDRLNVAVHKFTARGWHSAVVTGLDDPEQLTVDACGRIYVIDRALTDGTLRLRVFDRQGKELDVPARVEEVADRFLPVPIAMNAEGQLLLGNLCTPPCPDAAFDIDGNPVKPAAPVTAPYLLSGTYRSRALDSKTRNCQWHRLVVQGDLPPGTRLRVETFCADEEYDDDQVTNFATWDRREIAPGAALRPVAHDCLVPSPPGRFLWLKLTLLSNGVATPSIRALVLEFPRLSSLRYLPAVFAAEPASADFSARYLSLFDTTLRGVERDVDTMARFFDPLSTPSVRVGTATIDFLSWLASWIGVSLDRGWSEARRRRFVKAAGRLFASRGTTAGLRAQLLEWLGWNPPVQCTNAAAKSVCIDRPLNCAPPPLPLSYQPPPLILEHFKLRRWLFVGAARLGAEAVLWGKQIVNRTQLDHNARAAGTRLIMTPDPLRDPLHFYAHGFTVFVPACVGGTEAGRKSIENLLRRESPAHTRWDIALVEPRFRIGVQSMIGFDAVIGCLPAAARVGEATLGGALLVGSATRRDGRGELRAGRAGRVGIGARLQ
jgi:phage tail-like protein